MRASEPIKVDGDNYKIIVENQNQHEKILEKLRDIYDYIHDRINNDYWTLNIEENKGVSSPATWTEREVFNYTMETDAEFKNLVAKLKLRL